MVKTGSNEVDENMSPCIVEAKLLDVRKDAHVSADSHFTR